MSVEANAAVHRPAVSRLLQRLLNSIFGWVRNWAESRWTTARKPSRRGIIKLESLEPRLLLSADLVGSVSAAPIPDDVLPSDKINVSVLVRNVGASTSDYTPVVRLYASNTGQVDSHSISLGESMLKNSPIKAGKSVSVDVAADVSRVGDTGNFALFAVVDATNKVRESNENNNVSVAGKPLHVVWSFGNVPGHNNAGSITLTDDCGTGVTFTLTGPGRGDVVIGEDGFDLRLTGTTANSVLKITTSGGQGYTTLGDVTVTGSLKQIEAAKADLLGDLSIGGTIRSIELRNLEDGAGISIAGTGVPVKLAAGDVVGASIRSASAFESISIEKWVPGAAGRGVLSAPSIDKLTVAGAFGADLELTGAASGLTLSAVQVEGRITGGLWNVGGSAGQISAKSIEAPWQGSFEGPVQKIKTDQNFSGTLATPSIGTIDVGGSMVSARLLIGATLGNNGVQGRSATPDDHYGPGTIGDLRVDGAINNSSILVGVDPFDGIYGNGNDIIVGGAASRIQQIVVGGKLLGATSFIAGAFPMNVKINGQNVRSANVAQFHVLLPDTIAPQVSIALANDTGASAGDGVTRDPTLRASVIDAGSIVSLLFAIDDFSPQRQVDIQSFRQADGSLVIDEVLFASVLGGPLANGLHSVQLTARDATGNSTVRSLSFVLDRTAPPIAHFDLAPESDGGTPGDQLTNASTVALNGLAEPQVAFEVVGTGASGVTNSDGSFRIENLVLTEGDNLLTVRFTDLAGNQSTSLQTVRLDSILPSLQIALSNDTGASPTDGLTSDPAIAVEIRDSGLVTSWSVQVDGHAYSEQLIIAGVRTAFSLNAAFFDQLAGGVFADGGHTLQFTAHDMAGNAATRNIQFVLDRTPPSGPQFDLAPGSDTGVQGDQWTRDGVVVLRGVTAANAALTLLGSGQTTVADGNGQFSFSNVALTEGQNIFFVQAVDAAGNASQSAMVLNRDSTAPELSVRLANDTGPINNDRRTRDPSLAGQFADSGNVVSLTVSIDGAAASEYQPVPSPSVGFYIDGAVLDGQAGGFLADGAHTYRVTATDAQGNVTIADLDFVLERSGQTLHFDLAPESDSGVVGDNHTTSSIVVLVGTAAPGIALTLNGVSIAPAGPDGVFRVEGVVLALGANTFTIHAAGPSGNSEFTQTIYRDENPADSGLFPDLAVSGIHTQVMNVDEFGGTTLRVSWTTSNEGTAVAIGRHGAWGETVHVSLDDTPWNGDPYLGGLKVTTALAPGESEVHSLNVYIDPFFAAASYRIYVVTDDEVGFFDAATNNFESFANEVAEATAGEYNDLVMQDIDLGTIPDALPTSGPILSLNGSAVGGTVAATGDSAVYTFSLRAPTRLYFDSLRADTGITWTIRNALGETANSRDFAASDAFGMGETNPLLNLAPGEYELIISNVSSQTGAYGFRLLDPALAANHGALRLDGGALPRQELARGDWTDIYQFHADAGAHYVAGGPNDWTIDGSLYWRLFDPQGNQVWTSTIAPSKENVFEFDGTYTLMVEGRVDQLDPASYTAYVFTPQNRDIALTTGQHIQGFLDSPGQVNTYHFNLDEATVAFFDGYLESNGPYFNWTLQGPGGFVEGGSTRTDTTDFTGSARLLNLAAGEYSLTITGTDNAAGWYNFALFDMRHDSGTPLPLGQAAVGALVPGFNSTLYRFEADAGQEVTINLNTTDQEWISYDPVHWMVVDAAGSVVAQGQANTPAQATLDSGGSYALLIQAHQFNWSAVQFGLSVTPAGEAPGVSFDLSPESDTDVPGDRTTSLNMVNLAGVAAPFAQVSLDFTGFAPVFADETGAFQFSNVFLNPGSNRFIVSATDPLGNTAVTGGTIFQGVPPIPLNFDLALESDTGLAGDLHTTLDTVSLAGVVTPNSFVTILDRFTSTVSDATGAFRFDGISLVPGDNVLTVFAQDPQGNPSQVSRTIVLD